MSQSTLFPVIEASGTPLEIGISHGHQAKTQIAVSIQNYKSMFFDYSGISWDAAKRYALTFIPAIEAYDMDIMEEIRGIAQGSGFLLEEILALNVRSEIVLQGNQVESALDGGCTACAFMPRRTVSGETWLAQNWDWKLMEQAGCIILKIHQEKKPDIMMVTEAGIIGKIGFNSAGIGVTLNALASDKRVDGRTVPLHVALRGVLNSCTLSDAINAAGKTPLACCANFMIAGVAGQAVSVEIGPGDIDVIYPEQGWVAHTNHFYGARTVCIRDTGRITLPDSYLRLGQIQDMIRERLESGKIALQDIQQMLSDHMGYPDSICRHEDLLEEEGKRLGTVFSIIMNLNRGEMFFSPGCPCAHPYRLYCI